MGQKFRFAKLYSDNRAAVEKALTSMWCGEARNESQRAYVEQLKTIIPEIFAPKDAMPLVECMNSYEPILAEHKQEAKDMVGELWRKTMPQDSYYEPYEHQYQCWHTLLKEKTADGKNMSIVVTTGTGSGKTECFMLPLVEDLIDHHRQEEVQAIFIYPLNALMEDQKERMQKLLKGTNLTFAVYNADMPQCLPQPDAWDYKKVMRKIDAIRGITRDADGMVVEEKYPNIIATRDKLRLHPANILLINPTMLEYILLRKQDQRLIHERQEGEEGTLRWIALDETHTYTGAGAAEMAMLLRRVLMAYNVTTDEVRFATSSATIGKAGDKESEENLRLFIARITGLKIEQVRLVDGKRKGIDTIPHDKYEDCWHKLIEHSKDGYLRLDELIADGESIEDKLGILDDMCQKAEEQNLVDLRVKVHYFYRVPNHGLYVDLSDSHYKKDGSFHILSMEKPKSNGKNDAPLIEMSRCKHCGEYLAIAEEVKCDDGMEYRPITMDDNDMFDLDDVENTGRKYYVFATTNQEESKFDNNIPYIINGNRMVNVTASNRPEKGWHIVGNAQCRCPYCGTKLTKQSKQDEDNPDTVQTEEQDTKKLQKFRMAPDFISRLIAPSTLDLMTEGKPKDENKPCLHHGQQFISFVDSRQMAARSTIKQNLEEERMWVYGTIYRELCRRATSGNMTKDEAIKHFEEIYDNTHRKDPNHKDAEEKLDILEGDNQSAIDEILAGLKPKAFLSWQEILDLLINDKYADTFCQQFVERSDISHEVDNNGNIRPKTKRKYILAIMVEYLSKRPLLAASPETMGLFTSHYSDLEATINDKLPDVVVEFNNSLKEEKNRITSADWQSLMKIFIDLTVRSNQSVFLKMSDDDEMDIFQCVRYATQKERRRTVHKPQISSKGSNRSRIVRLLAKLIANDKSISIQDAISGYKDDIQSVIDCMWDELTLKCHLLEHGTHYDKDRRVHVDDEDEIIDDVPVPSYRLNLARLGFKLYEDVYLCDTNTNKDNNHVEWLKPVETTFHGYSPYLIGGEPVLLKEKLHESWLPFPYHNQNPTAETVNKWAEENRKLLWQHDLWGENGVWADRYEQIHQFPDLFIQSEHTAQVDKVVSRQIQEDFRDHRINILACSTTMEMGVDIGDLELVMMTSVPPMPANYKQRAGRSGRRGQVRSACVTLCGSDAVGIRTLLDPMKSVILRQTNTPTVDLNSAEVVKRHINAFLVREFGVFAMAGDSVMNKAVNYYTNYELVTEGDGVIMVTRRKDNSYVNPTDGLGDATGTPYEAFNNKCSEAPSAELREKLERLLADTFFRSTKPQDILENAKAKNTECYDKLRKRIQDYAEPYEKAKSDAQRKFFKLKFIEPLAAPLLSFWATHRFTPNANMPVNVIEFDINSTSLQNYTSSTQSNPSYPLRTALSQYAPGNPIAIDGIVRIVRGIRYTNFFKPIVTFDKLYFNKEQVVVDKKDDLDNLQKWRVSGKNDLDLLRPAEFIPDMNESASRILDNNVYTRVSAQLIETGKWEQNRTEPHLFNTRSSRESGNGKILYYNEGSGYGYCHCTKCGKTVLEHWAAATASDPDLLPSEMNDKSADESDKPNYHFSLIRKRKNKPNRCFGCNSADYIKRNVVLGDTIQTDYTEIRIRHANKDWINSRGKEENLLITLGLLFTRALSEVLNVERTDLDFTITPNGHLCIFDTNPGGSGYANQLAETGLMKTIIETSHGMIEAAETAGNNEALIDRSTLYYVNSIDIQAAKDWIEEEYSAREILPENIKDVFGNSATETTLTQMETGFRLSQGQRIIFVDNDYKHWDYEETDNCWKGQFINVFAQHGQQTSFCVAECSDNKMPEPALNMIRAIKGWTKDVIHIKNPYAKNELYPLAYFDGFLYFTNNPNHITMNDKWGNGTIYYVRTENIAVNAEAINTTVLPDTTTLFFLKDDDEKEIKTSELANVIYHHASDIIDKFVDHCKQHRGQQIKITYQDEHMKSVLAIMLSLQTIEFFVKKLGNPFSLKFLVERYETDGGRSNSPTANQPSYRERDEWLENFANEFVSNMNDEGIDGTLCTIESSPRNELTHWRVLTFECADMNLSIYPDGGFMNGWYINNRARDSRRIDMSYIQYCDNINLYRNQDLKFDVKIE